MRSSVNPPRQRNGCNKHQLGTGRRDRAWRAWFFLPLPSLWASLQESEGGWACGEEGETIPEMSCYSLQSPLFGREIPAAKTAGVEAMLNYVYRRAPAEPLGSPNLSNKGFSFSCAVENLLEQKTARFALDSVPGVWPGGAGEGGDPNKTHQPGLL